MMKDAASKGNRYFLLVKALTDAFLHLIGKLIVVRVEKAVPSSICLRDGHYP